MKQYRLLFRGTLFLLFFSPVLCAQTQVIPLPEHPRPDFERNEWINLNGLWDFRFDRENIGEKNLWYRQFQPEQKILVPFPWGSPLSGVANEADIGWYARTIDIPGSWKGKRIFLVIGASDWRTTAWLDGKKLGFHQGGYTPFEFEITPLAEPGEKHRLVVKVDDSPAPYKLEGKQGYGQARGFWQTVYLEARGSNYLSKVH
jgi:beta-galactosidase/beta-glucuronidase